MSQSNNPEWPPRSPREVLLSTPGGREKLRRLAERASPSPSPIRRSASTSSSVFRNRGKALLQDDMDDDDDDEETLQLQLQEIQARLKLKKLKRKAKQTSDIENDRIKPDSAQFSRPNSAAENRARSRLAGIREERLERSKTQTSIHVPVSPIRRTRPAEPQRSPGRVLLGIDKGLKGSDISLKKAPILKRNDVADSHGRLTGPFLQRPMSQSGVYTSTVGGPLHNLSQEERPKTFSERIAAIRSQETDRQERESRIKRSRSKAFDIDHLQMQNFKETAIDLAPIPRKAPSFSREEVLDSYNKPTSNLPRSKTTPNLGSVARNTSSSKNTTAVPSARSDSRASINVPSTKSVAKATLTPSEVPESETSQFEPYSSTHLSRRIIPHQVLTRTLTEKKTFLIPDLLRAVKGPDFLGPDIEEDLVVFGIIASKSQPKVHQNNNSKNQKKGKFMIMTLTDLKWELDLFLFDTAFEKFWKLTPGTIIAILNPLFMPPPPGKADTGKFSLTLNSDADTVLEIGSARDLGFCKSVKRDGKTCDSWVDKRHTEFCDFHVNQALKKTHAARMEVNTMTFGKGGYGGQRTNSSDTTKHFDRARKAKEEGNTRYDKESHSQIYIGKKSTVNMLDDVDFDPDAFHRGSTKEERMTRRLLEQEKERELRKKLSEIGGGLGANYMGKSLSSQPDLSSSISIAEPPPDTAALGLLSGRAKNIALSPVKRKRANTTSSTAAMGWGSNLTKELGRMKNGENLQPVKKKTRFVTEKGIRVAGRESFGGEAGNTVADDLDDDDDYDDDLDIVRE